MKSHDGLYEHYKDYKGEWNFPNFTLKELSCKHCGEFYFDKESIDNLQRLRISWGKPIVINSAHRCRVHNKNVGGTENSQHLKIAFDCVCPKAEQDLFIKTAKKIGFKGIGKYPSKNFVHLDMGQKREWNG